MAVLAEDYDVVPRLAQLGLRRDLLLDVVRSAVGGRRSSTFHPLSAASPVLDRRDAHLRRVFVPQGWEICRGTTSSPSSTPRTESRSYSRMPNGQGIRCSIPLPCPGRAPARRAIELGQFELWPEVREKEVAEITAPTWVLFVFADGDDVRAELSCPIAITEDQLDGFHERIVLVQKGGWDSTQPLIDEDEPAAEYDVTVSRKA